MFGALAGGDVVSRVPIEVDVGEGAPLIVTPDLYLWPEGAPRDGQTCTAAPPVALFCARGLRAAHVREEIVPRLQAQVPVVVLVEPDAGQLTVFGLGTELTQPLVTLGLMVQNIFGVAEDRTAELDALARSADVDLTSAPLRLWDALVAERRELVNGEAVLHVRLADDASARATLEQITKDAEVLVREPRREADGFTCVGPVRARVDGDHVDLRVRMSAADARAAFAVTARRAGDDRAPTVLGALLARGDGTVDGWSCATTTHASEATARAAGDSIAAELTRWTGAKVTWLTEAPSRAHDTRGWYVRADRHSLALYVPVRR